MEAEEAKALSLLSRGISVHKIKADGLSTLSERALIQIHKKAGLHVPKVNGGNSSIEARQQRLAQALEEAPRLSGDGQLERDNHGLLVGVFPDKNYPLRWYAVTGKACKDTRIGIFDDPLQAARARRDYIAPVSRRSMRTRNEKAA